MSSWKIDGSAVKQELVNGSKIDVLFVQLNKRMIWKRKKYLLLHLKCLILRQVFNCNYQNLNLIQLYYISSNHLMWLVKKLFDFYISILERLTSTAANFAYESFY